MRKWWVPIAVLGASGLGAFLYSDKGRGMVRRWLEVFQDVPERLDEWNEATQTELERIQNTLNQIAQSLEPHGQAGH